MFVFHLRTMDEATTPFFSDEIPILQLSGAYSTVTNVAKTESGGRGRFRRGIARGSGSREYLTACIGTARTANR